MNAPAVALVGALGHGLWHRRSMHRLAREGRVRVVGLSARRPIVPTEDAPTDGVPTFTDYRVMLDEVRPDIVIICTPPHTHLAMARDVFAVGADLLLEKPPVPTLDEHRRLAVAARETGRLCQVNFQALGSTALAEVSDLVQAGGLGTVETVDAVGAWWRPDSYFTRSAWAGRRAIDGHPVMDGALVNPFAHAVMQALAVADAAGAANAPITMDLERYRSRDIEVDDVACMRLTFAGGLTTTVAVTLASATFAAGEIITRGARGSALLEYPKDRVQLPGDTAWSEPRGRTGLLENLLDHRTDPTVPLIAPLSRTALFTVIAEAIVAAPLPERIDARHLSPHPDGTGNAIDGIEDLMRQVVREHQLPSGLSTPWAVAPYRTVLDRRE
ncbi:MAG: Gfo/Idh/MocA family oxidoreductase [Dactylosporangium sp.]|nr:Gfo/Idh/MocA family oxidoreductase [Dactylosporangium sp.]NNJ61634.1 Gfo/Idh/MocA family oxidoreductase [Dactylosporangium sp.]